MESSRLIANIVINRLKVLHLNRVQLAELTHTQPSTITKWLSGSHNFTLDTLDKLSIALNINFFTVKEEKIQCFPCDMNLSLNLLNKKEE